MKLFLNKTSPYARLVRVVAIEKGLADAIDHIWVDPWASPEELLSINPLGKVPALVTDENLPISESSCICDYLEFASQHNRLLPLDRDRPGVLRKLGLGRGLIDVSFGVTIERRFAEKDTESVLAGRWLQAVSATIGVLESMESLTPATEIPDMGDLAIAVGLSYTHFRLPEIGLGIIAPRLSVWMNQMCNRPSFVLTNPE